MESRVGPSPLIGTHVSRAHQLLPLAALFGVCLAAFVIIDLFWRGRAGQLNQVEGWAFDRRPALTAFPRRHQLALWHRIAAVALVVLAVLTGIQVYRVAEAGAKAAWSGRLDGSQQSIGGKRVPLGHRG